MKKYLLFALMAVLMFAAACSEPLNEAAEVTPPSEDGVVEETPKKSHWGNKINDPYSVSNMRLAFKELMKDSESSLSKAGVTEREIEPTHLHLKFIPKNDEELDLLEADAVLDVVPIPFNYDLENFDGVYRDPECPSGQPTYQYSVVRIGHKLPNVEYVVLDSLFMLYDDEDVNEVSKNTSSRQFWNDLEYEALKLTGNLAAYKPATLSKRYKPSGKVNFWNGTDSIAVPNAKVHANFSTHKHTCYTNEDGTFTIPGNFKNDVHFHVYFKNDYANVYNCDRAYDKYDAASYGGKGSTCFDFCINTPIKKAHATTHKAAYDFSLTNKVSKKDIGKVIKLCVYNDGDMPMYWFRNSCEVADIINFNQKNDYKVNYGVALNAIAAIMLMNDGKNRRHVQLFNQKLQDSWRTAVEYYVGQENIPNFYPYDMICSNRLIIDLIDDDKNVVYDQVSGFTLSTIEANLKKIFYIDDPDKQWEQFKTYLKQGKSSKMQENIDKLFDHWK